jgi:RND family efflux transporter MFP subunit
MPRPRNRMLSIATRTVVSAGLLVVAAVIFGILVETKPQPAKVEDPPSLRRVEVMKAIAVPVRRQWHGFGTAQPADEADIPAEVTAVVLDVPDSVDEGAAIQKGDVFARLDDTDFILQQDIARRRIDELTALLGQLALEEQSWKRRVELAGEDVQLAEADLERVQDAMSQGAARQREVDQAKQKVVAAVRVQVEARDQLDRIAPRRAVAEAQKLEQDASLRMAEKNVERCTVRSPLSGYIAAVDVAVGESLSPGQRVGHVVNLDHMELPLRLPASARAAVTVGDEVVLRAMGPSGQAWTGTVGRISPIDDQNTRTMIVFVEISQDPGQPGWLAPGRFVEGTVISRTTEMRFVVPRRSLLGDRVLLVEDGTVTSRPVTVDFHVQGRFDELGVTAEQWAVLADRLNDGTQIVVNAVRSLTDGARIEPISMGGQMPRDARASHNGSGDP